MNKLCPKCGSIAFYNSYFSKMMCNTCEYTWIKKVESLSFPILNNLTPTVDSCTKKLIEELGELLQLIGKGHQASGEQIGMMPEEYMPQRLIEEAFDVAQSAVTMINTLADKYDISIEDQLKLHEEKLREKGYLV